MRMLELGWHNSGGWEKVPDARYILKKTGFAHKM